MAKYVDNAHHLEINYEESYHQQPMSNPLFGLNICLGKYARNCADNSTQPSCHIYIASETGKMVSFRCPVFRVWNSRLLLSNSIEQGACRFRWRRNVQLLTHLTTYIAISFILFFFVWFISGSKTDKTVIQKDDMQKYNTVRRFVDFLGETCQRWVC